MKLAKILSVAAAVATTAALAASASAELVTTTSTANGLSSGTGMWLIKPFCPAEGHDLGLDLVNAGSVVFTIKAAEPEWFEGQTGGAVVVSCGPTTITPADHNWASKNFWGVVDEDLELDTHDAAAALQTVKVGDYTYELTCPIDDTNCVYAEALESEDGYVQFALQEWGSDMSTIEVVSFEIKDKSGATMAMFDGDGNLVDSTSAPADDTTAPADDTTAGDTNTDTDTTTTTTPDKTSPETGVEGVAAVAALAAVAAGAVVLSRKRK